MAKKKQPKEQHKKAKTKPKAKKSMEDSIFHSGSQYLSTDVSAQGLSSLEMEFDP